MHGIKDLWGNGTECQGSGQIGLLISAIINGDNVLETITATETTSMKDGSSATSSVTAISILWQRIDNNWRLGYLHASEIPEEN